MTDDKTQKAEVKFFKKLVSHACDVFNSSLSKIRFRFEDESEEENCCYLHVHRRLTVYEDGVSFGFAFDHKNSSVMMIVHQEDDQDTSVRNFKIDDPQFISKLISSVISISNENFKSSRLLSHIVFFYPVFKSIQQYVNDLFRKKRFADQLIKYRQYQTLQSGPR